MQELMLNKQLMRYRHPFWWRCLTQIVSRKCSKRTDTVQASLCSHKQKELLILMLHDVIFAELKRTDEQTNR